MREVAVAELVLSDECQCRWSISWEVVDEYAQGFRDGATFPAIKVFLVQAKGDHRPFVVDGWHRTLGAQRAEVETLPAEVVGEGTLEEAAIEASKANTEIRGLRRSYQDKRAAVDQMLRLRPSWSDRSIAEHCRVSHPFVGRQRAKLEGREPRQLADPGNSSDKRKRAEMKPPPNYGPVVDGIPDLLKSSVFHAQAPYGRLKAGVDALIEQAHEEFAGQDRTNLVQALQGVREHIHALEPVGCPSASHQPAAGRLQERETRPDGRCAQCLDRGYVPRMKSGEAA